MLIQRAQISSQELREHINSLLDQVDSITTLTGLLVDGGALFDVVRYIGNMNTNLIVAVGEYFDVEGIVNISTSRRIDRADILRGFQECESEKNRFLNFCLVYLVSEIDSVWFGNDGNSCRRKISSDSGSKFVDANIVLSQD
jgi:hypothetical protein